MQSNRYKFDMNTGIELHSQAIKRVQKAIALGELSAACLRMLPAETAHDLALHALKKGWHRVLPRPEVLHLTHMMKSHVRTIGPILHPIGLAAGFDKNAHCIDALADLNFSSLEVGTITPIGQIGNKKPRLFRLPAQRSLINRMGFNNIGAQAVSQNWKNNPPQTKVPIGINIGKNKVTANEAAVDDYMKSLDLLAGLAQYFVVNISSPNTPGLRELAEPGFIKSLGHMIGPTRLENVWLKLDPDMTKPQLQKLTQTAAEVGFAGLILANTHAVTWPETGGFSGAPLATRACQLLEWCHEVHNGQLPMISVGGVFSGSDVYERLIRGASMVQIYTAFVYRGPWVVTGMLLELRHELQLRGFRTVEEAIGSHYE